MDKIDDDTAKMLVRKAAEMLKCDDDQEGSANWLVGTRVVATKQITEGGNAGDPNAVFPDAAYIHAEKDEPGTVEHVDGDGEPTIRFDRTGTATIKITHFADEEDTATACNIDLGGVAGVCGVAKMNTPEPIDYTSKASQVNCPQCLSKLAANILSVSQHLRELEDFPDPFKPLTNEQQGRFVDALLDPNVMLENRFVPMTQSGKVDEHLANLIAEKAAEADALGIGKWGVRVIPTLPKRPFSTEELLVLVAHELGISVDRITFEADHDMQNDHEIRLIVKTHLVDNASGSLAEQFDRVKVWNAFSEIRRKIPVTAKFIVFVEIDEKRFELEEHRTELVDSGTGDKTTLIGRGRGWYRLAGAPDEVAKTIGRLRESFVRKESWSVPGTYDRFVDGKNLGKVQIRSMNLHTVRITDASMEVLIELDLIDQQSFTVPIPPVKKFVEDGEES